MRFMSHPVNFNSDHFQEDNDKLYNMSISNAEVESISSDS